MPRVYVNSRGHVGGSLGCIGIFFVLPFILFYALIIGAVLAPGLVALVAALLGWSADGLLRIIPAYRRRRRELPLNWPKFAAWWGTDLIDSVLNKGKGKKRRRPVRNLPPPTRRTPVTPPSPAKLAAALQASAPAPPPPAVTPPRPLNMQELGGFQVHVRTLFTAQGWTALAFDGNQMIRGTGPDGAHTVIVCDAAGGAQVATQHTVEVACKIKGVAGVARSIVVSHGTFDQASTDLALRSNVQLIDGAALTRLEASSARVSAS